MLCSHDTPGQEIVSETKTKRKREITIKSMIGISITTQEYAMMSCHHIKYKRYPKCQQQNPGEILMTQTTNTYQTYSSRYDNHALEKINHHNNVQNKDPQAPVTIFVSSLWSQS